MKSKGETESKAKNPPLKRKRMLSGRKKQRQRKEQVRQPTEQTKDNGKQSKRCTTEKQQGKNKPNKEKQPSTTRSPYCIQFISFTRVYHGQAKKPNTVKG